MNQYIGVLHYCRAGEFQFREQEAGRYVYGGLQSASMVEIRGTP